MQTILVTGTDTGVGKTWLSSLLVRQFRSHGLSVGAYKPVCSGAEHDESGSSIWSDVEVLRSACGDSPPIDLVCPQRFQAPVAPNVAARLEGRDVDDALLLNGVEPWRSRAEWLVVEGAGGIFCPLSNQSTVMDLATGLQAPVIVVAANRLGVISHTRLTVEAIQTRGLSVAAVVLNDTGPTSSQSDDSSLPTNAEQLLHWLPNVSLLHCRWRAASLSSARRISGQHDELLSLLSPAELQK